MNSRTTWILLLAAMAMLAFIVLWERTTPGTPEGTPKAQPVFPGFQPSQVTELELIPRALPLLRLEHTNRQWHLTRPLAFPAHEARVNRLLLVMKNLTRSVHITAQELLARTNALAAYGLDSPAMTVVLRHGNDRIEFRVGQRNPLGTQAYFQVVGADGVDLVPAEILEVLPPDVDTWRDHSLLGSHFPAFDRLQVRLPPPFGFALQRDSASQNWQLLKPLPARADTAKIELLIQDLRQAHVARFVPPPPPGGLETMGLQPPQLELVLGQGTNDLPALRFGHSPTNTTNMVFGIHLQHSNLFLAEKELIDRLRVPFTTLRDHHLFTGRLEGVDEIQIQAEETVRLQRQTNQQWLITAPGAMPADAQRVREGLDQLCQLEIVEFSKDVVTDFAEFGLAKPAYSYLFYRAVPLPGGSVSNSLIVKVDFSTNQADRVFTRRSDENPVYAVRSADVQRLPRAAHQWRDRQLPGFTVTNVTQLVLTQGESQLQLNRLNTNRWTHNANTAPLPDPLPLILEEMVLRLSALQAEQWLARGEDQRGPFGLLKPDHGTIAVRLASTPETWRLELGDSTPGQSRYAGVVLGGQYLVFELAPGLNSLIEEIFRQLTVAPAAAGSP